MVSTDLWGRDVVLLAMVIGISRGGAAGKGICSADGEEVCVLLASRART